MGQVGQKTLPRAGWDLLQSVYTGHTFDLSSDHSEWILRYLKIKGCKLLMFLSSRGDECTPRNFDLK